MENLLLLLATTMLFRRTTTDNYSFKRYFIDNTGCSVHFPSDFTTIDKSSTADGDTLFFKECAVGETLYGMIAIQQQYLPEDADGLLYEFMTALHHSFSIEHQIGITFEASPSRSNTIRGYVDYWQDAEGIDWKAKGWTDGQTLAVLYVKNINGASTERQDYFLNSFQFPNS